MLNCGVFGNNVPVCSRIIAKAAINKCKFKEFGHLLIVPI